MVVCYTDDPDIHNGSKFAAAGLQTAAGVPLMCDEPDDFRTFRVGLFGLDKLHNVERTVASLETALSQVTVGPTSANGAAVSRRLRRIAANPTNTSLKIALFPGLKLAVERRC